MFDPDVRAGATLRRELDKMLFGLAVIRELAALASHPPVTVSPPAPAPPAPVPVSRPAPKKRAATLVAPSAPDGRQLRARVPTGLPSQEDFVADLADTRAPAKRRAQVARDLDGLAVTGKQRKAALASAAAGHREAVRGHGQTQRAALAARRAARAAEVAWHAALAKSGISAAAGQRKAALRKQIEQDAAAAGQATQTAVSQAQAAFTQRRQALTQAAEQERGGVLAAADAEATRAVAELEAAAVECERAGAQEASRFTGDNDAVPKQRAAAMKVGRDSAADIRAKKTDVPGELRKHAVEHGNAQLLAALREREQGHDRRAAVRGRQRRASRHASSWLA